MSLCQLFGIRPDSSGVMYQSDVFSGKKKPFEWGIPGIDALVCQYGFSTLPQCKLVASHHWICAGAFPNNPMVDPVADGLAAFLFASFNVAAILLTLAAVAWPRCINLQCPKCQGQPHGNQWLESDHTSLSMTRCIHNAVLVNTTI